MPYMYIKEKQAPQEKMPTSKGKAKAGRRKLSVMVFMRLGYAPVAIPFTGSDYPGMPALKQYKHPDSDVSYQGLGNQEYQDAITKALIQLTSKDGKSGTLRSGAPLVLLHDNDTAHTAQAVKRFVQKLKAPKLLLRYLPSHSPDLTPLDSSFLAEVKRKWHKAKAGGDQGWADLCQLALRLIRETNAEPYIKAVPLRWQACVDAQGGHIEVGF